MKPNLFSVNERVALVTGGNGGLGRAMALGLQSAGARVVVTGRNAEKNEAVGRELGDRKAVYSLDVRDEQAVEQAVEQIVARYGRIDILVNNAGCVMRGSVLDQSQEDWKAVIETHLTGAFLCSKHAARIMAARGDGGKIINIGSMYSIFGPDGIASYASAKTGILGLTRALAVELAVHNIQVNAILPGWFSTDLTRAIEGTPRAENIRRKTPARRWGNPDDVVGTAVFLASPASNFVTGASIPVDGGYSVAETFISE